VKWYKPMYNGGLPVTKYLVEWDSSYTFNHANSTFYSEVVLASDALVGDGLYKYQITKLSYGNTTNKRLPLHVRVSAYNGEESSGFGGYSVARTATPNGDADTCNTFPNHCSILPADQLPYLPVSPYVQLSYEEVANRLELSWRQPTVDSEGFSTDSATPHTSALPTKYQVDFSTDLSFANFSSINVIMKEKNNVNVTCHTNCSFTLGREV